MKDCYNILEVSTKADLDTIRTAYHQLAKKLHPDVNPSPQAAERFKDISAAYYVLSDPHRREQHDRKLNNETRTASNGQHRTHNSNNDDNPTEAPAWFTKLNSNGHHLNHPPFTVPSWFANIPSNDPFFTGHPQRRQQPTQQELSDAVQATKIYNPKRSISNHPIIALTYEEALNGAIIPMAINNDVQCVQCSGRGRSKWRKTVCKTCGGGGSGVATTTRRLQILTPTGLKQGDVLLLQDRTKAGKPVFLRNTKRILLNVAISESSHTGDVINISGNLN